MSKKTAQVIAVSLLKALLFVFAISLGAQLDIDIAGLLPLTGQTLVILTGALFLPPFLSTSAVLFYIVLGLIGLPVYADAQSGWQTFSGPSLGYFVGFLLAAALISLRRKRYSGSFIGSFTALFAGHLVVLTLGSLFLIRFYALSEAFAAGFRPFMTGALVKSMLGAIVYFMYEKTVKFAQ